MIQAALRQVEQTQIFLGRKNFLRAIGKAGRHDAFNEEFGDFFGGQRVDDVIERQDSTECGDWVASQRFCVGIEQSRLLGGATGIVVLDDYSGGPFEFRNQAAGGFQVDVI